MWTETKCNESPLGKLKCQGRFSIPRKLKLDFRQNLIPGSSLWDENETCCLYLPPHRKIKKTRNTLTCKALVRMPKAGREN